MSSNDTNPSGFGDRPGGHDPTAELLTQALREEAAMVDTDPAALHEIQHRTNPSGPSRRPWLYAGVGAAAATAAIIAGITVVGDHGSDRDGAGPAATDGAPTQGVATPTPTGGSGTPTTVVQTEPGEIVYVGTGTHRLYSEKNLVPVGGNAAVMDAMLTTAPEDPDYVTGWPEGLHVDGMHETADGPVQIDLSGPADLPLTADPALGPNGGNIAVQALLRNGMLQPGESATFTYNGDPITQVLGVDLPVTVATDDDVRGLIQITNLSEGEAVDNPVTVTVSGNVFEGNVNWQLLDSTGAKVDDGFVTTSMGQWSEAPIKLGRLDAGTYTIRALEYSPEDGSPGQVDDKTFTVQ